jgi:branched-chain amino acid transport system substrate-binding protein
MRRTYVKAVAALFAVSLVAAACGDDDDDSSDATSATTAAATSATTTGGSAAATTAGSSTGTDDLLQAPNAAELEAAVANDPLKGAPGTGKTRGITDTSVKFGCVIQASAYDGAEEAFKARFERANAEGGVHGRKIEMLACEDDAVSESTNLQLVRRQVLQEEVFGMLTVTAQTAVPSTDFMTENEVPYFGWALNPGFCGHRWGFGLNGCLIGGFLPDLVPHAVDQGNISLAIIKAAGLEAKDVRFAAQSADDPTSAAGAALYQAAFENAGATVVYNEHNMPLQTSDYTPTCRRCWPPTPTWCSWPWPSRTSAA